MEIFCFDEGHFCLNDKVNTQISPIWLMENHHVIQEQILYLENVKVWCGFTDTFVNGQCCFKDINTDRIHT